MWMTNDESLYFPQHVSRSRDFRGVQLELQNVTNWQIVKKGKKSPKKSPKKSTKSPYAVGID